MATAAVPILTVWVGRLYPGVAYLMMIYAIQEYLDCMTGPGTSILRGLGRPWQEFAYTVPNMLLATALIPLSRLVPGHWSAVGLGTAMVTAQVLAAIGFVVRANYLFEVPWRQYLRVVVMPSLIPYMVGGLISVPLSSMITGMGRWRGATLVGLAGLFYLVIVALVIDQIVLANEERNWFRQIIRSRTVRVFGFLAAN
jgi:hypothetical protein